MKFVLITGCSSGIGEAAARALGGHGFAVFAGVRKPEDGEGLAAEVDGLYPLLLDVTSEGSVAAAARLVAERTGREGLMGVVNNAGIVAPGLLEFLPLEDFRGCFEVNLFGLVRVTRHFLPLVRRYAASTGSHGHVVNVGSIAGRLASPLNGAYGASKHAVAAVTQALRFELGAWPIHVTLIEPGSVATPIWNKGREAMRRARASLPEQGESLYGDFIERIGRSIDGIAARGIPPEEVAGTVLRVLLSRRPRLRYVVGADARLAARLCRWLPERAVVNLLRRRMEGRR